MSLLSSFSWSLVESLISLLFSIEVIEEDDDEICINDELSSNALSPIEDTEEGIWICLNDEQPRNA